MNLRKVKIMDSVTHDCIIILTDAPKERIREWIEEYKKALNKGKTDWDFSSMAEEYHVLKIYDSDKDTYGEAELFSEAVGFDEVYDLHGIEVKTSFNVGKKFIRRIIKEAMKANDRVILDSDSSSITVKNIGIGPDFLIKIEEA